MTGAGDTTKKKPPLSCTSCRARKLRCDKQDPCRNCVRSKAECVFPARKRIQRPRKTKNADLVQRLDRLESIVAKVGGGIGGRLERQDGETEEAEAEEEAVVMVVDQGEPAAAEPTPPYFPNPGVEVEAAVSERDQVPGGWRGVTVAQDTTAVQYMSGQFWASLCDEVGGLRQALEQSTDTDEDDEEEIETSPESFGETGGNPASPDILPGIKAAGSASAIKHPSPDAIRYLASVFFRNVDMHLKILHQPTLSKALDNIANYPELETELSPERTALLFAVYYAAVTSLTNAECNQHLGRSRADLSASFQAGIEQALNDASYLNNTQLEPLQALTLYVCCLRSHNGSRASWALLGLLIRLAQGLGIHQDGQGGPGSRFTPFEAEMRRRLWWQLIVLDIRAAEDRGTSTVIPRGSYNTRLPHNIDDSEFGPETTEPLRDRPGPSDATFSLLAAQSSGIFLWAEDAPHGNCTEDETLRRARHLEEQFVKNADLTHVGAYLASIIVRLIILKMWLVMRYPLHRRTNNNNQGPGKEVFLSTAEDNSPEDNSTARYNPNLPAPCSTTASSAVAPRSSVSLSRQATLRTAISVIELTNLLETGQYADRIRWWCETYVQWHPLAVALVELCVQTRGELVDHAWQVIEFVFPRWSDKIADAKRGSLWSPIRKLYKKAKAARASALSTPGATVLTTPADTPDNAQLQPLISQAPRTLQSKDMFLSVWEIPEFALLPPQLNASGSEIPSPITAGSAILDEAGHATAANIPERPLLTQQIYHSYNHDIMPPHLPEDNTLPNTTRETTAPAQEDGDAITQAFLSWPDLNLSNNHNIPSPFDPRRAIKDPKTHHNSHQQSPGGGVTSFVAGNYDQIGRHDGRMRPNPDQVDTATFGSMHDDSHLAVDWNGWNEFVLDTYAGEGEGDPMMVVVEREDDRDRDRD
ncbi:hypothetical protein F4777DRAFT_584388 [Nemania sp. FL0916]|nr:hypothetical protein F4777DRAFT_584388 [Nemania sp. FL0916]